MEIESSLYPDILFHFTTRKCLFKILEETFRISYAREKINGGNKEREFAVPIVSFCDLKLSELKSHMKKYGSYGIGLTKNWANSKGLNPVLYINKHSPFASEFIDAMKDLFFYHSNIDDAKQIEVVSEIYSKLQNTFRYIKNYEGDLVRNGINKNNYRYADEREWRYVPPMSEKYPTFVPINQIQTTSQKSHFNNKLKPLRLDFSPDDIKYLIIKRDDEISDLIRHLQHVKSRRFDKNTIDRLSSRILTAEQINNDI